MKKRILFAVAVLFCTAGFVQAGELGIDVDTTYVSKYMWRGFDRLDDVSALQPSVNLDLFGTGFSFNIWASYAGSGGNVGSAGNSRVNFTEYNYTLAYGTTLFEGESYVTQMSTNYIYYDFIDQPSRGSSTVPGIADAQEIGAGFAWPDLCPMGIVPSYYVGRIWESRSNSTLADNYAGWVHVFGLGYDMTVSGILPDIPEQVISLGLAAVYNDGFGGTAEHDWTHIVLSAKTSLDCGPGTFTPGIYFQKSMDDAVNTSDEFWTSLSYAVSF